MAKAAPLSILTRSGAELEVLQSDGGVEVMLPIECSEFEYPATITLDEPQMKFVYSAIGRVLAGRVPGAKIE